VEALFCSPVSCKMLDAGEHVLTGLKIAPLETLDPRGGEQSAEKGVLAAPFDAPAPALVASDVDHRREGPVDPGARRLERRRLGGSAGKIRLETRDLGERNREDGPVAVNDG